MAAAPNPPQYKSLEYATSPKYISEGHATGKVVSNLPAKAGPVIVDDLLEFEKTSPPFDK